MYGGFEKNIILEDNADVINYKNIEINNSEVEIRHASKTINNIISKEEKNKLEFGTYLHGVFERTDFLNITDDNLYKDKIKEFVQKLNITSNTKIYKEHEFICDINDTTYHGIIDLILVEDNYVKIVDYKLKNIDDEKYIEQLRVYYNYVKTIFDKEIKTYLYSIVDDILKEVSI